jgi:hypothetical protein
LLRARVPACREAEGPIGSPSIRVRASSHSTIWASLPALADVFGLFDVLQVGLPLLLV